jgi:hypothetical protein
MARHAVSPRAFAALAASMAAAGTGFQAGLPWHHPVSRRLRSRALRSFRTSASFSNWLTAPKMLRTIVAVGVSSSKWLGASTGINEIPLDSSRL